MFKQFKSFWWKKRLPVHAYIHVYVHDMYIHTTYILHTYIHVGYIKNRLEKKKKNRIRVKMYVCMYDALPVSFVSLYPTYRTCFKVFRPPIFLRIDSLTPTKKPGNKSLRLLNQFPNGGKCAPFVPPLQVALLWLPGESGDRTTVG